mmetsp:Transcript_5610/g.12761  ORF Transcript_5610/g.12761 Transcript_5610/m.12761 type:complete len:81 (+) Transcript_5610:990-1232(+)
MAGYGDPAGLVDTVIGSLCSHRPGAVRMTQVLTVEHLGGGTLQELEYSSADRVDGWLLEGADFWVQMMVALVVVDGYDVL